MTPLDSARPSGLAARSLEVQLAELLAMGGDERIAIPNLHGRNRYGCGVKPDPDTLAFASSTASTISPGAFTAAAGRLEEFLAGGSPREAYRTGAARVRSRLAQLCGPAAAAENIVLAASGTDLHLIAADLARGPSPEPIVTVAADPRETGRGVAHALRGRRYGLTSPHGAPGREGEAIAGAPGGSFLAVQVREANGAPRPIEEVDAECERACLSALRGGGRAMLVLLDVSKTGLVAPSPACAAKLKRRFGDALTVLVDACQFRISDETLAGYLANDFLVAVTGSKFLGGPAFSGALILPDPTAARLRKAPLGRHLGDYSGRDDWPASFLGRAMLPDLQNLGLLLRWEAALHEFEAFRRLPASAVARLAAGIAGTIQQRLAADETFEPLAAPAPPRAGDEAWDAYPTLFGFFLRRDGGRLSSEDTEGVHRRLRGDDRDAAGGGRVLLGQPVAVGEHAAHSALRLAISARQITEALARPEGPRELAGQAMRALDAARAAISS